jgi:hypothetical protein
MENKLELTVEEKRELAMEVWKNHLLSVQYSDEQVLAAEKNRLIDQVMAGRTRQPVGIHHMVNHYG